MQPPYEECQSCIATPWCKRYKGESPKPDSPEWCNPHFRLTKALGLTNIPKKYIEANVYNYKLDQDNESAYTKLKPILLDVVKEIEGGKNFFFHDGKPGTGKTFHASMILNQYIYKTCLTNKFNFENPLGMYVVYAELMDDLRYRRDSDETQQLLDKVYNTPLLLLDDVGSGTISEFVTEQTYLLYNYRYNNNLSTITTSNLNVAGLVKVLGTRIVSRLRSNCIELNITGRDRR